jgi:hypothetical protein
LLCPAFFLCDQAVVFEANNNSNINEIPSCYEIWRFKKALQHPMQYYVIFW